ncbi:MAG: superoxide dismutase family protein, partial [Candidatus Hydrogenedentales bacterium]
DAEQRHAGDLGNIEVGDDGTGSYSRVDERLSLSGENSIIGRGFIVHAGQDDLQTQPSGDAGARVLVGVIAVDGGEN